MADPLEDPNKEDSLYAAVFQCFSVILCGYITGALELISPEQAKGLGTYVGTFALPCLTFYGLAKLEFSVVNWMFLLSMLLAKALVFFCVLIFTLLLTKPMKLGRAGIFAIFCTQSNDFALGYPIIDAVYKSTHPEYVTYLYLMAPISLAILNPIAFVFMEINKQRMVAASTDTRLRVTKLLKQIAKGMTYNPILVMTILGIITNVIFKHRLNIFLEQILEVFGRSFAATALFLLGLRMVGQMHRLYGKAMVLPVVIILVKTLILPLVMRQTVSSLKAGVNETDTSSLSTYAFLYGTLPTAPAVFIFSNMYKAEIEMIATSMVVCTIISAPVISLSAKLINISKDLSKDLGRFNYGISVASLVAVAWLISMFIYTKKYKRMPHRLTLCLIISQLIQLIGVIWAGPSNVNHLESATVTQQCLQVFGMYSTMLWTATLAYGLLMFESRGAQFVTKLFPALFCVCFGASAIITTALMIACGDNPNSDAVRLGVLILCLLVTTVCLIVYIKVRQKNIESHPRLQADVTGSINETTTLVDNVEPVSTTYNQAANGSGYYGTIATSSPQRSPASEDPQNHSVIDDLPNDDAENNSGPSLNVAPDVERPAPRGGQTLRHTVLLVFYDTTMFVSAAYSTWCVMGSSVPELQFLEGAGRAAAGLLAAALLTTTPTRGTHHANTHAWTNWFKTEPVKLPEVDDLSFETNHVCEQFIHHHLAKCKEAIATNRRYRMRVYKDSFPGSSLCNWLVNERLASDQVEATTYGAHLLDGRVIRHIKNKYHFENGPRLYCFN